MISPIPSYSWIRIRSPLIEITEVCTTAADRSSRYTETLQRQISFDGLGWKLHYFTSSYDFFSRHSGLQPHDATPITPRHPQRPYKRANRFGVYVQPSSFNSDEPSCALSSTSWYHRHTFLASLYMFHPKCMRTEQLHPWVQIIGKSRAWSLRTQPGKTYLHTTNYIRAPIGMFHITHDAIISCSSPKNLSLLLYGACCIRFPATLQAFCLPGVFIAFAIVVPTITSHHGI